MNYAVDDSNLVNLNIKYQILNNNLDNSLSTV